MKIFTKSHASGLVTDFLTTDDATFLPLPWVEKDADFVAQWQINNPPPPDMPPPVPEFVRSAQLYQWLIDNDLAAAVDSAFETPAYWPTEKARLKAKARWTREVNVNRADAMLEGIAALLGMTSAQVDAAFIAASLIP